MNLYELITKNRVAEVLVVCSLFGCAATATEPAPCPTPTPEMPPPPPRMASVVRYQLDELCQGPVIPLGLDGKGMLPSYARDDDGGLYRVTGPYEGFVYVKVNDQICLPGGDYDGYQLFTLGPVSP